MLLCMSCTGGILAPVSTLTRNTWKSKPSAFSGSYTYAPNFKSHTPYATERKRHAIIRFRINQHSFRDASTSELKAHFASSQKFMQFSIYKGTIDCSEHNRAKRCRWFFCLLLCVFPQLAKPFALRSSANESPSFPPWRFLRSNQPDLLQN